MGQQPSTEGLRNDFLVKLQDDSVSNDSISWNEGLSGLPSFHRDAHLRPDLCAALNAASEAVMLHSPTTRRCGALCRALCGLVAGHSANRPEEVQYAQLCNLLVVLQSVVRALHGAAGGCPQRLARVAALPGGGDEEAEAEAAAAAGIHAGHLVADTMVAFVLRHPVLNMHGGCIDSHCLALAVLTACTASDLYASPADLLRVPSFAEEDEEEEDGDAAEAGREAERTPAQASLVDYLANHASSKELLSALLSYVNKADFTVQDRSRGQGKGVAGLLYDGFSLLWSGDTASGHASAAATAAASTSSPAAAATAAASASASGGGGTAVVAATVSAGSTSAGISHTTHGASAGVVDAEPTSVSPPTAHLGRRAVMLLCVLLYHKKNASKANPSTILRMFRADDPAADELPIGNIYGVMCRPGALRHPEVVLLFYTLLIENGAALDFVLNASDVGRLVVPLSEVLNRVDSLWEFPAMLYVLLSAVLMLSQYRRFNAGVHATVLPSVSWYTGRVGVLKDISAGSLLILNLVKVVQGSVFAEKDEYATRQALSIISNMGPDIRGLHEYPARRLVQLAVFLAKTACRTVDADARERFSSYLSSVAGCVAMCLAPDSVADNVPLLYELLHQGKPVEAAAASVAALGLQERTAPTLLGQLVDVTRVYSRALDEELGGSTGDVTSVMRALTAIAQGGGVASPLAGMELPSRFGYAEDPTPEGFFLPYLWELVVNYYDAPGSMLHWDMAALPLFSRVFQEDAVSEDDGRHASAGGSGGGASPSEAAKNGPSIV